MFKLCDNVLYIMQRALEKAKGDPAADPAICLSGSGHSRLVTFVSSWLTLADSAEFYNGKINSGKTDNNKSLYLLISKTLLFYPSNYFTTEVRLWCCFKMTSLVIRIFVIAAFVLKSQSHAARD